MIGINYISFYHNILTMRFTEVMVDDTLILEVDDE